MTLPEMAKWGQRKGIDLLGTGDFTHPLWFRELKSQLEETSKGLYKLKDSKEKTHFLLSTEISSIYSQGGRLRRIHTVIFAPSLEAVEKINNELLKKGANLMSDGRPIVGLSAHDLTELILSIEDHCLIIPAHIWTPWFSLYGSESGFDSIEECFGELTSSIFGVETGLSSDPAMNWRIAELDSRAILSFSDAHSPAKLGREATVFEVEDARKLTYEDIRKAVKGEAASRIVYTIEFYPEEGKYHYTGHRNCNIRQSPQETKTLGSVCPVCGRGLTVGVMHRVEKLANREEKIRAENGKTDLLWNTNPVSKKPPYVRMVPLLEILAEAIGSLPASQKVINEYIKLTENFGSEFNVLLKTPYKELDNIAGVKIAEGVVKVRKGQIVVEPGYDGIFGKVKIWSEELILAEAPVQNNQLSLFK